MDLSLTSPALVAYDRGAGAFGPIHFIAPTAELAERKGGWRLPKAIEGLRHKTELFRMARLEWLRTTVCMAIAEIRPAVVALEDYATGGQGMDLYSPELGGMVKNWLWRNGIPFAAFSPKTLKSFLAGRGDARKEEMCAAALAKGWLKEPYEYGGSEKSSTATGDVVDAMAVVRFLDTVMTCRNDAAALSGLSAGLRRALTSVSDSDGYSHITRPFAHRDNTGAFIKVKGKKR